MNRYVVAGVVGLALTGCAVDRPAAQDRGPGPVGMTTFPSIYETINRENPQVDPASNRAGFARGAAVVRSGDSPGAPFVTQTLPPKRPAATEPTAPAPAEPGPLMALENEPRPAAPGTAPAAVFPPSAPREAAADPAVGSAPDAVPAAALAPGQPTAPTAPAVDSAIPPAVAEPAPSPAPGSPMGVSLPGDPAGSPASPIPGSEPNVAAPAAPTGAPLTLPAEPGPAAATAPAAGDPSVGASPDAVPLGAPPVSSMPIATAPAPGPVSSASALTPSAPETAIPAPVQAISTPGSSPAPLPAPAPDPSVGVAPDAVPGLLPAPGPSSSIAPKLQTPATPLAAAPAEPQSGSAVAPSPIVAATAPATSEAAAGTPPKKDSDVKATSTEPNGSDPTTFRSPIISPNMKEAGRTAARVGDDVITLHELSIHVRERLMKLAPPGSAQPSKEQLNTIAAMILNELTERVLIAQEAKRELKNPKQLNIFMDQADKVWREDELPPMLKQYHAVNEYELKEKLAERGGQSLGEFRDAFRQDFLAKGYMKAKLSPKLAVSLPEMREYYNAHLSEFDRPALVTWREAVVETRKFKTRTGAKKKADAILAKLRHGEDFAKVVQEMSHGPNRKTGGLWETSPGGYAVEEVNKEIETLPLGQISRVIETPTSFHIIRVESRREAGPASFIEVEVQERVKQAVHREKVRKETEAFVGRLRKRTVITTMFDGTASDPQLVRAGAESPR